MSLSKLAPLAAVALLLSSSAHADPVRVVRPTSGLIMNGWPIDLHSPRPAHKGMISHGLINVDWPDDVRAGHSASGLVSVGWPLDTKVSPRPTVAPKGH